jgi:polar amino acid transport system substrate-binding protein
MKTFVLLALAASLVMAMSACGEDETTEPSATPTAEVSTVATVPTDELVRPGRLVACMDMPYPPMQYFDEQGDPIGVDVDLLTELSARLGLEPVFQNSVYDTIIAALKSGKCDLIWADQLITPEREAELTMLPYWKSSEVFIVVKGNPEGITDPESLCGRSAAGQSGALEIDALEGFSEDCEAAGQEPIDIQQFQKSPDAMQALQAGHVDVYVASLVTGSYLVDQTGDQFEISYSFGLTEGNLVGISSMPENTGLSSAVDTALQSMVEDGTYQSILEKYNFSSGSIF